MDPNPNGTAMGDSAETGTPVHVRKYMDMLAEAVEGQTISDVVDGVTP